MIVEIKSKAVEMPTFSVILPKCVSRGNIYGITINIDKK